MSTVTIEDYIGDNKNEGGDIDRDTTIMLVETLNFAKKLEIRNFTDKFKSQCIDKLISIVSLGLLKIIKKVDVPTGGMRVISYYKASNGNEFSLEYFIDPNRTRAPLTIIGFNIPSGVTFNFNKTEETTMNSNAKNIPTTIETALKLGRGGEFAADGIPAHLAALQNSAAQAYINSNDEMLYKEHVNKALETILNSIGNVAFKQTIIKEFVDKYAKENNLVLLEPTTGDTNEDPTPEDRPAELAPVEYCWEQLIQNFLNDPLTHETAFKLVVRDPIKVLKEFRILTLNGPRQRGKTEAALATVSFDSSARLINATSAVCSRGYSDARATSIITKRTLDIRRDGISPDTFKNVTVLVIHQDGYPLSKSNPLEEVLYNFENNPTYFHPDFKIVVIG